jgi:tetratricopeptide (TPR) repeat protein
MGRLPHVIFCSLMGVAFMVSTGCDDGSSSNNRTLELEDPEFRQGLLFEKQHEPRRALECFLKVIDSRKGAAESHLEAGRMWLDLKDPLPAIYHFNQYIRLKPNSEQSLIVKQMIKTAEKLYAQQLPGRPFEPDEIGIADQSERVRKLQIDNDRLKREVTELSRANKTVINSPVAPMPTKGTDVKNQGTAARTSSATTYTVLQNDTLSSISRKFFGTDKRSNDILKANSDKLKSPAALRPGMVLTIPQ